MSASVTQTIMAAMQSVRRRVAADASRGTAAIARRSTTTGLNAATAIARTAAQ
jgi:hypothetical protein